MRSAVSARPLRAPCVEMKYSSTDRPSRKLDLIGRGMISPFGLATRPRMPAIWRTCIMFPRAPEWTIMWTGLVGGKLSCMALATSSVAPRPDLDELLATLEVGDQAALVLLLDLGRLLLGVGEQAGLGRRRDDVGDGDGHARAGRPVEAQRLELVERVGHVDLGVALGELVDRRAQDLLVHLGVDERVVGRQRLVEDGAAERRLEQVRLARLPSPRGPRSPRAGRPSLMRMRAMACSDSAPDSKAMRASATDANARPSPSAPASCDVMK